MVDAMRFVSVAIKTIRHIFILSFDQGEVGDAGPSDTHTSAEHAKPPQQPGGWVRGHQRDGGGYTREMPSCITGK